MERLPHALGHTENRFSLDLGFSVAVRAPARMAIPPCQAKYNASYTSERLGSYNRDKTVCNGRYPCGIQPPSWGDPVGAVFTRENRSGENDLACQKVGNRYW
jgi:hypothetical protein